MDELMRKANPGLKSRFNSDAKFVFADYSDEACPRAAAARTRPTPSTPTTATKAALRHC